MPPSCECRLLEVEKHGGTWAIEQSSAWPVFHGFSRAWAPQIGKIRAAALGRKSLRGAQACVFRVPVSTTRPLMCLVAVPRYSFGLHRHSQKCITSPAPSRNASLPYTFAAWKGTSWLSAKGTQQKRVHPDDGGSPSSDALEDLAGVAPVDMIRHSAQVIRDLRIKAK